MIVMHGIILIKWIKKKKWFICCGSPGTTAYSQLSFIKKWTMCCISPRPAAFMWLIWCGFEPQHLLIGHLILAQVLGFKTATYYGRKTAACILFFTSANVCKTVPHNKKCLLTILWKVELSRSLHVIPLNLSDYCYLLYNSFTSILFASHYSWR